LLGLKINLFDYSMVILRVDFQIKYNSILIKLKCNYWSF